jgi:phosphate transport system ATP-binding protein
MSNFTTKETKHSPRIHFSHYHVWIGETAVLRDIDLEIFSAERLAIIGQAGSGKTTLLRSLNRLNEMIHGWRHQGSILFHDKDILAPDVDSSALRRRIGLIAAQSPALPGTIFENIAIALRLAGVHDKQKIWERVQAGLAEVHLWDQFQNRLSEKALYLPTQIVQRMNLARALALEPEILLFDDLCAGLDNVSATLLEDILEELKERYVIVFTTNNPKLAARASDRVAFFHRGEMIEWGTTRQIFTQPKEMLTHNFITERF